MGIKFTVKSMKIIVLIFILFLVSSCGEIVGSGDISDPDLGDIVKVELFLSEDSLFLNLKSHKGATAELF